MKSSAVRPAPWVEMATVSAPVVTVTALAFSAAAKVPASSSAAVTVTVSPVPAARGFNRCGTNNVHAARCDIGIQYHAQL